MPIRRYIDASHGAPPFIAGFGFVDCDNSGFAAYRKTECLILGVGAS